MGPPFCTNIKGLPGCGPCWNIGRCGPMVFETTSSTMQVQFYLILLSESVISQRTKDSSNGDYAGGVSIWSGCLPSVLQRFRSGL